MSDQSGGEGWWMASDGKWYPPDATPGTTLVAEQPPAATETGGALKGLAAKAATAASQAAEKAAQKHREQQERTRANVAAYQAQAAAAPPVAAPVAVGQVGQVGQVGPAVEMFEYQTLQIRTTLVGDKIKTGDVDKILNAHAGQGWRVKSIVETSVKGRVGPGGVQGLLVVFERRRR